MARVHTQKKNRGGKEIKCGRCQAVIQPGETYYSWKPRYGMKGIRCKSHYPRPSELTSSKMGEVWDAQQDAHKDIDSATSGQELADALGVCIDAGNSVKDQYEESRSNMPDHLQDVGSGAEMQEKMDALESWVEELESKQSDLSSWEGDGDDRQEGETKEEAEERQFEEARDEAREAVDSLSV